MPPASRNQTAANASQSWQLGPRVPQTGNSFLRAIGAAVMRLFGWRFTGAFPNKERFVVIIAPHTSNWDFFILLAAKWTLQLDVRWMGKDSVFRGPVGWFLRAIGGIPVERTKSHNLVDASVLEFAKRDQLVLVLAPEGTRKKVARWKSGFWHIAQGAGVPIVCVAVDFAKREMRFGPEFSALEADAAAGIARIRASYAGVQGRNPELQG